MIDKKLAVFGDSILRGVLYDGITDKYRLNSEINWSNIENNLGVEVANFSKMGYTSERGKNLINKYVNDSPLVDIALIEYGGNDSDYEWLEVAKIPSRDYLPKVSLNDYINNIKDIICALRTKNIKPVLMTLPPIDANRYFQKIARSVDNEANVRYFLGDKQIIYRRQEMYSNQILKVARQMDVPVIDVREEFLNHANFPELLCDDGIHLNTKGFNLITKTICDYFASTKNLLG